MSYYSSFVVRFWIDDSGNVIKGQLEHAASRKVIHFRASDFAKIEEIYRFTRDHLRQPPELGGRSGKSSGELIR